MKKNHSPPTYQMVCPNLFLLQFAASGNLKEFERLYKADTNRIRLKDNKGMNVAHHAAGKNRLNILDFIISHGGGKSLSK